MTHAQTVFLAHWMSMAIILHFLCEHYAYKRKKARRQCNAKRTQGKIIQYQYTTTREGR